MNVVQHVLSFDVESSVLCNWYTFLTCLDWPGLHSVIAVYMFVCY